MSDHLKELFKDHVREVALKNGFKLKDPDQPGRPPDLPPYVYDFAENLIRDAMDSNSAMFNALKSHIKETRKSNYQAVEEAITWLGEHYPKDVITPVLNLLHLYNRDHNDK